MKLLSSSASPFGNKVLMAGKFAGVDIEMVSTSVPDQPAELLNANPLGKVPCLVLDDGSSLFDSRAITQYIGREHEPRLYPADNATAIARYEALCDGICDGAVAWMYEKRVRPEEKQHQPWLDYQWGKVMRGLDEAQKELPEIGDKADMRAILLGVTLGYLNLRFPGQWEAGHSDLVDWEDKFDAAHPDIAALKPHA